MFSRVHCSRGQGNSTDLKSWGFFVGLSTATAALLCVASVAPSLAHAVPSSDAISATDSAASTTAPIDLGPASKFSVLAAAAATIPASDLPGEVGAQAAITDDANTKYHAQRHAVNDSDTQNAVEYARSAYTSGMSRPASGQLTGDDLAGQVVTPGVYHRVAAYAMTTPVTFDAQNNPDAVFIMQSDAALNTTAGTTMNLINGATASNIFWVLNGAATLGASSTLYGTILSNAAITVGAASNVIGRALSVAAAVTLDATKFTAPDQAAPAANPAPSTTSPIDLGPASKFSVLAAAAATIPASDLPGEVGAQAAITDDANTKYHAQRHAVNDSDTQNAVEYARSAYTSGMSRPASGQLTGDDLAGQVVTPGVYHRVAAYAMTTPVTFDAQNNPDAVFIMQSDAALNTTAGTTMNLINGATASNIFWVLNGAATLGASSTLYGTILSNAAITVGAASNVIGRALSVAAAVTLDATKFTAPDGQ